MFSLLLLTAAVAVASPSPQVGGLDQQGLCDSVIPFRHSTRCDVYYECNSDGTQVEHECPDGLVYSDIERNCVYLYQADLNACDHSNPANLQEPISTLECPRQNGAFTHEDPSNCREYYWCINGLATLMKCSPGLHFDEFRGQCHWAHEGFREGCVEKRTVLADGFTCPNNVTQQAITGETFDHARYADDADCRNFYTCNNGNEPMKVGCPDGLVFNDVTLICDDPKNVPGCENYYGEEEAAF